MKKKVILIASMLLLVLSIAMLSSCGDQGNESEVEIPAGKASEAKISTGGEVQTISTDLEQNEYPIIIVQKGIPVEWNMKAEEENITSCNNKIIADQPSIEKPLNPGDNIIKFTPKDSGVINYSCWMGMINSYIVVVDDIENYNIDEVQNQIDNSAAGASGGGCCAKPQ
ncbi:MAG: hypothetical protein ACRCUS_05365 [Anaerovoracaceae bacterium]